MHDFFSKKKIEEKNESSSFELTTEIIMVRAIERGLSLLDFNDLTLGMIIDYIIAYDNDRIEEEDSADRQAAQSDFDAF